MTNIYNTGNPIGSTDPRDAADNKSNFDEFANSTESVYTDRFGVSRLTQNGALSRYSAFSNRGEWTASTSYNVNDIWRNGSGGAFYLVPADYTSGATAAEDIANGSVVLYQDPDSTDRVIPVNNVTQLRTLINLTDGQVIYLKGHTQIGVGSGELIVISDQTTEVDNNGTIFVVDGKVIERQLSGFVTPQMFGAIGNQNSSTAMQGAVDFAETFGCPVVVEYTGQPLILDSTVNLKQGSKIIGRGFKRRLVTDTAVGSAFIKNGNHIGFSVDGDAQGERLRWVSFHDISIDGSGNSGNLIYINNAQNVSIQRCQLSSTTSESVYLKDLFDCFFEDSYFQTSGTADVTPSFVIDDTEGSNSASNNNITMRRCTWEANAGLPLRIFGEGTGPGNSLFQFEQCKWENLDVNTPQVQMEDASGIVLSDCLFVSRGTSGNAISSQLEIIDCTNIRARIDTTHNSSGATLASIVKTNTIRRSDIEIYPATTGVVDNLSNSYIVDNSQGTYDAFTRIRSAYMGSPIKSLLQTNSLTNEYQPQSIDVPGATIMRLSRNGGTDANTSIHFNGSTNGDMYLGKNASGGFSVSESADLPGTRFFSVDRSGRPFLGSSQLTVGGPGSASNLPSTPSGYVEIEIGSGFVVIPYYNKS